MDKKFSSENLERILKQVKDLDCSTFGYLSTRPPYQGSYEEVAEVSTRPLYQGSYEEVAEVFQREFGVTRGDDSKPVLATHGLGPCVAMVGWSPEHKVGFLTHYDALTELADSFGSLLYIISQQLKGKASEFDVRIIGGRTGQSERIINFLKESLNIREDIKMKLIEEETGGYRGHRSIALDTRTGEVFSYDPKLNPQRRELTELDMRIITSGFKTTANLAYAPERA